MSERKLRIRGTIMAGIALLAALTLALNFDRVAGALEIHRGGGKTVGGKVRTSAMPYTYDIAEGNLSDHAASRRFGYNAAVGATFELIWNYADGDPFISGVTTIKAISSSTADTTQTLYIEGLDGDYEEVTGSVALNGRTYAPVTQTFIRVHLIYVSAKVAGDIYVAGEDATEAAGVPQEPSLVLGKITAGWGQSQHAFLTIPANKHGYITGWYGSTSSAKATQVQLKVRSFGGAWRVFRVLDIYQGQFQQNFDFPIPVTQKADISISAAAAGGGGSVAGGVFLWYED